MTWEVSLVILTFKIISDIYMQLKRYIIRSGTDSKQKVFSWKYISTRSTGFKQLKNIIESFRFQLAHPGMSLCLPTSSAQRCKYVICVEWILNDHPKGRVPFGSKQREVILLNEIESWLKYDFVESLRTWKMMTSWASWREQVRNTSVP